MWGPKILAGNTFVRVKDGKRQVASSMRYPATQTQGEIRPVPWVLVALPWSGAQGRAKPSQANSCLLVPSQQMGLLLYQPIADRVLRVPLGEPTFFSKFSTWNAQHFNWSFQQGILFSISCPLTQLPILYKFQREPLTHFHLKKGHPAFNFFHQVQGDCFLPNFWLQPN